MADPFWAGLFSAPEEPMAANTPAPARSGRERARKSRRLMEVMATLGNACRGRIIPSGLPGSLPEVLEGHADAIGVGPKAQDAHCLLYTSDAADEEDSVDLGGRRII